MQLGNRAVANHLVLVQTSAGDSGDRRFLFARRRRRRCEYFLLKNVSSIHYMDKREVTRRQNPYFTLVYGRRVLYFEATRCRPPHV